MERVWLRQTIKISSNTHQIAGECFQRGARALILKAIRPCMERVWLWQTESVFTLRMQFSCQERTHLGLKWPNQISYYVVIRFICAQVIILWKIASLQKIHTLMFSCQEWSHLGLKWPNQISYYIVIHFICAQVIILWKIVSLQKIRTFMFPVKLSIAKQSTLWWTTFTKKLRNLDARLVYLEATVKLLVLWCHAFIFCCRSLRMNGNKHSR